MLNRNISPRIHAIKRPVFQEPYRHAVTPHCTLFTFPDKIYPLVQFKFMAHLPPDEATPKAVPFLLGEMLSKGTPTEHEESIAERIESCGADLHITMCDRMLTLTLTTLKRHFAELLPLVADILTMPTFPSQSLATEKGIAQQKIAQQNAHPRILAKKMLMKGLFTAQHPYGYYPTCEAVGAVTSQDLQDYFQATAWHEPYCVLTGDLTDTMTQATIQALERLPQQGLATITAYARTPDAPLGNEHRYEPTATQASIAMGMHTLTPAHPDYADLLITTTLLGGYFGSRLMQNIREDKGYTYGIQARLNPLLYHTYLSITAEVKSQCLQPTIEEIHKEIRLLQTVPVREAVLHDLKKYFSGHLLKDFDNTYATAMQFAKIRPHNLDLGHYTRLYSALQEITPVQIQCTAQRYLSLDQLMQVTISSDPKI